MFDCVFRSSNTADRSVNMHLQSFEVSDETMLEMFRRTFDDVLEMVLTFWMVVAEV